MKSEIFNHSNTSSSVLKSTFFFIPGIGVAGERHLWRQGCHTWDHFLENPTEFDTREVDKQYILNFVFRSITALDNKDFTYFEQLLGPYNAWRAWPEFREQCVYLDIETDGGQSGEAITMVGLYDGKEFKCLIRGQELESFPELIQQYSMVVTFFGASFDLPMLRRKFQGVNFNQIHIDLCPTLKELGYKGGLKKIEKQLGIVRDDDVVDLGGREAISLWKGYERGSINSLKKLISYNREDVVNLEKLMDIAFTGLSEKIYHNIQI
jgi:uncharacterized protein YprB with RNaseH-like and TPR domain